MHPTYSGGTSSYSKAISGRFQSGHHQTITQLSNISPPEEKTEEKLHETNN